MVNWAIEIDMNTLMCIKLMTNKNLLYEKIKFKKFFLKKNSLNNPEARSLPQMSVFKKLQPKEVKLLAKHLTVMKSQNWILNADLTNKSMHTLTTQFPF